MCNYKGKHIVLSHGVRAFPESLLGLLAQMDGIETGGGRKAEIVKVASATFDKIGIPFMKGG